jgi:hypothetical protein
VIIGNVPKPKKFKKFYNEKKTNPPKIVVVVVVVVKLFKNLKKFTFNGGIIKEPKNLKYCKIK